jgi:pimeloyl-ACP methyl ester carboxylesterase
MLSIRGLPIALRTRGSGDPVLLINGLARPMESWNYFADALRGRTVIIFDGPGVGLSGTPVLPHSMPMLADVAARVLDAVAVEQADVVGFSHGGAVAQQFAVGHSARVNRLVLMSTSCGVGAVPGRSREVLRSLLKPNRGIRWPRADPVGILWQIAAISTWSSIPVLGRIDAPTLLICGEHDRVVPRGNSRLIAARIRNARHVTIQAGHDLQMPGPAAAAGRIVQQFLDPIAERR